MFTLLHKVFIQADIIHIFYSCVAVTYASDSMTVLLRRAIALKVICEQVKFSFFFFAISFVNMNENACKLFKNVLDHVRPKCDGDINMV